MLRTGALRARDYRSLAALLHGTLPQRSFSLQAQEALYIASASRRAAGRRLLQRQWLRAAEQLEVRRPA